MINEQDEKIFQKHYELFECWQKHQFVRNYEKDVYSNLLHLYTSYINQKHSFSHWCSSCRAELVNAVYTWYISQGNSKEVVDVVIEVDVPLESAIETDELILEQPKKKRGKKTK